MSNLKNEERVWSALMPLSVGFVALVLLVGVIGVWSVNARIAGAVIASGTIQVQNDRQVVQHPDGGVVGEIISKDGDTVAAGEVLLRLDDALLQSELSIIDGEIAEIRARKARLEAERDGLDAVILPDELSVLAHTTPEVYNMVDVQVRLFEARNESLRRQADQISEQIAQAYNQIDGTNAQLLALQSQKSIVSQELIGALSLLEKGLAQTSRVSLLQREEARLSGEIGNLTATIAQIRGQIAAFDIQRLQLDVVRREEANTILSDLQYREIELVKRRLSAVETLSRLEIRSPVSGVVHGSQFFAVQAVIAPGASIMYIVPQDQPFVVSARIESNNIDQVHIGQEVTLRFVAFDQQTTPELFGQVSQISADVFTDEATGQFYYEAELLLREDELLKLGGQKILPGMPVEAFIRTSERSPLSYLVKPLSDYFTRAFR